MEKPTTKKPLWLQKGVILEVLPNRSYRVKTSTGEIYRRNRCYLKKIAEPTNPEELEEEEPVTNQQPSQDSVKSTDINKSPPPASPRRSSRISRPNPKYYSKEFTA